MTIKKVKCYEVSANGKSSVFETKAQADFARKTLFAMGRENVTVTEKYRIVVEN